MRPENVENQSRLEKTIQVLGQKYSFFDMNERMFTSPLSDQLFTIISLVKCFPETDETKNHLLKLDQLYKDPITFVLKKYETNFSEKKKYQISIRKTLGQLEWIFFRDSHRFTALKKEYSIDSSKPKITKSITFEDVSAIRGYVKRAIAEVFIKIIIENNVDLNPLNLPQIDGANNNVTDLMGGGSNE